MDVETVNETVAEVKTPALVDTVRHTSIDESKLTWQQTRKRGGLSSSAHTGRQTTKRCAPDNTYLEEGASFPLNSLTSN